MTLKKGSPKSLENSERLKRYHGRKAAEAKYGKAALKGKTVHHKDGNNMNNAPSNLELVSLKEHGKHHGRGNGKLGGKRPK